MCKEETGILAHLVGLGMHFTLNTLCIKLELKFPLIIGLQG